MSVPQVARLAHSAKAMSEFILGAHHGRPVASETAPQVAAAGTGAAAVATLTSRDEHAARGGGAEMISETGIMMGRAAIPARTTIEAANALPRANGRSESAVEYSAGTAIYYGSTIALQAIDPPPLPANSLFPCLAAHRQAHHGGFLCFGSRRECRARASTPSTLSALFSIWNQVRNEARPRPQTLGDRGISQANLADTGSVRYGDCVWLQLGRREVGS